MNPPTADWSETLVASVRDALARMDTTLTLPEAKAELGRHLSELREIHEDQSAVTRP